MRVEVTIYVRTMSREEYEKRFEWLTVVSAPEPFEKDWWLGETFTFHYSIEKSWGGSDALTHLERIANHMEHENGALLYVNHESIIISTIANAILKFGRDAVRWEYRVNTPDMVA